MTEFKVRHLPKSNTLEFYHGGVFLWEVFLQDNEPINNIMSSVFQALHNKLTSEPSAWTMEKVQSMMGEESSLGVRGVEFRSLQRRVMKGDDGNMVVKDVEEPHYRISFAVKAEPHMTTSLAIPVDKKPCKTEFRRLLKVLEDNCEGFLNKFYWAENGWHVREKVG